MLRMLVHHKEWMCNYIKHASSPWTHFFQYWLSSTNFLRRPFYFSACLQIGSPTPGSSFQLSHRAPWFSAQRFLLHGQSRLFLGTAGSGWPTLSRVDMLAASHRGRSGCLWGGCRSSRPGLVAMSEREALGKAVQGCPFHRRQVSKRRMAGMSRASTPWTHEKRENLPRG